MGAASELLTNLLEVADRAVPLIGATTDQGEAAAAAVAIGQSIVRLIDSAAGIVGERYLPLLQARRNDIEARVLAHAGRTVSSLGGGR